MINTTLGKAYGAFIALNQVRSLVKGLDALHIFALKNQVKPAVDFMSEEELRLVEEAGGVVTESGMVMIADPEKKREYLRARKELDAMPYEVQCGIVEIRIDRCPEVTGEQIELLDGFVIFREGETDGNK